MKFRLNSSEKVVMKLYPILLIFCKVVGKITQFSLDAL